MILNDFDIAVLFVSILVVLALSALSCFSYLTCTSSWEKSGMAVSYGPIQGCLIFHDGKWIPESNYREMP